MLPSIGKYIREKANPNLLWHPSKYAGRKGSFTHEQCADYTFKQVSGVNKYEITREIGVTNKYPEKYTCVFHHEGENILICEVVDNLNGGGAMTVIFEHGKPATNNIGNYTLLHLVYILVGRYASSFEHYTIDSSRDSFNNKLLQLCKAEEPNIDEIEALIKSNPHVTWNYLAPFKAAADVAMKTGHYECVKVLVERFEILKGVIAGSKYTGGYFDEIKEEENLNM